MPAYDTPLTQAHCDMCTRIIETTPQVIQMCKDCIEDGYPFGELLPELEAQLKIAQATKARHFPDQP